jgi:hypothetical protein
MVASVRAANWPEVKQDDPLASPAAAGAASEPPVHRTRQPGKLSNEDAIAVLQKPLHHVREELSLDPPVPVREGTRKVCSAIAEGRV